MKSDIRLPQSTRVTCIRKAYRYRNSKSSDKVFSSGTLFALVRFTVRLNPRTPRRVKGVLGVFGPKFFLRHGYHQVTVDKSKWCAHRRLLRPRKHELGAPLHLRIGFDWLGCLDRNHSRGYPDWFRR